MSLPADGCCQNWSSPWGAPMIKCHADTTPAGRGFRSGDARDYRFANAYRRFAQSRICTTVLLLVQKWRWGSAWEALDHCRRISYLKNHSTQGGTSLKVASGAFKRP